MSCTLRINLVLVVVSVAGGFYVNNRGVAHQSLHHSPRDVNWNAAVDVIVRHAQDEILNQEKTRVVIGDIDEQFEKDLGGIKLKGMFRARDGWLEDFSTLTRVGDVNATRVGSVAELTTVLKLQDLRLGYNHYEAKMLGRDFNGTLNAMIPTNSIRFVVRFNLLDTGCETSIFELQILEFDDLRVRVTGFGGWNLFVEHMLVWGLDMRRQSILETIENQLRREIEKGLQDFHCDEYATLLMLPL